MCRVCGPSRGGGCDGPLVLSAGPLLSTYDRLDIAWTRSAPRTSSVSRRSSVARLESVRSPDADGGLEPPRGHPHQLLRLARLPFRHIRRRIFRSAVAYTYGPEGHWPNWIRLRSPKPAIPGSSPGCPVVSSKRNPAPRAAFRAQGGAWSLRRPGMVTFRLPGHDLGSTTPSFTSHDRLTRGLAGAGPGHGGPGGLRPTARAQRGLVQTMCSAVPPNAYARAARTSFLSAGDLRTAIAVAIA